MSENKNLEYFNGDELAASVWKSKYALEGEETADDLHKRLAKEFARVEKKYQKQELQFAKNGSAADRSKYGLKRENLTEESIYQLFKDFKYIVPQGSIMYGLGRKDKFISLSNCFFIGQPIDSYGGIMQKDEELVQLMKRRGGVGIDISTLRPSETPVSNSAGTSTGAISFMERFSNSTREVGQNSRRGALMITIDINHPDVKEFAKIKSDLTKVTGANISIRLNKEFMKAVENDEDYLLQFPCNNLPRKTPDINSMEYNKLYKGELVGIKGNLYLKRIKAKEYWDEIIKSARNNAEPG
ncbi:MAG TPA: hypothetical protein VK982_05745, partial [Bacteroidales bacterium]|nr:hypothetical protein [Bacteroidales bacterium]